MSTETGIGASGIGSAKPLTTWFKSITEALYGIHPQADSQSSLPTMFSSNAQIFVNHAPITVEEFQNNISSRAHFSRQSSVLWKDVIEVPPSNSGETEAEIIAGVFVHTRSLGFRIRAGPAQTKTTVVFSAKIGVDPKVTDEDARRILELYQTQIDEAVPIQIRGVGHND